MGITGRSTSRAARCLQYSHCTFAHRPFFRCCGCCKKAVLLQVFLAMSHVVHTRPKIDQVNQSSRSLA